jgi:hypothetical protein
MEPAAHESTVLQTLEMQEGRQGKIFMGHAHGFASNILDQFLYSMCCAVLYFPGAFHILEAMFIFFLSGEVFLIPTLIQS